VEVMQDVRKTVALLAGTSTLTSPYQIADHEIISEMNRVSSSCRGENEKNLQGPSQVTPDLLAGTQARSQSRFV